MAAEACYHNSCYRSYTRPVYTRVIKTGSTEDKEYSAIESEAYQKLFDYIRSKVLDNPHPVRFKEISEQLTAFMEELSASEIKESTKTQLRGKVEVEFKGTQSADAHAH